jgi:hypothetical protein
MRIAAVDQVRRGGTVFVTFRRAGAVPGGALLLDGRLHHQARAHRQRDLDFDASKLKFK